jgi:hypothetical protein
MLTLLAIVAVAVLIVVVAKTEGAKSLGLMTVGVLCILLGSRATVILTDTSLGPVLVDHAMAEDPSGSPDVAEALVASETDAVAEDPQPDPQPDSASDREIVVTVTSDRSAGEDVSPEAPVASDAEAAEISSFAEATPVSDAADTQIMLPPNGEGEKVRYITRIEYLTENRPDWLDADPTLEGQEQFVSVRGGPYPKTRECERHLDKEILRVTREYIDEYLGTPKASALVSYNLDEIKDRLVETVFSEKLDTSVGIMNQVHARLRFDRAFRNELDRRWARIRAGSRLLQTGMGAAIVLLLIGILFTYFRLDTATKGYFTGRLQFAASAAILALVAASVLLARWIPWM